MGRRIRASEIACSGEEVGGTFYLAGDDGFVAFGIRGYDGQGVGGCAERVAANDPSE